VGVHYIYSNYQFCNSFPQNYSQKTLLIIRILLSFSGFGLCLRALPIAMALSSNNNNNYNQRMRQVPKLVAFDLDGTIWSPDMYMLWGGGSPFRFVHNKELRDCRNSKVKLLGISGEILDTIASSTTATATATNNNTNHNHKEGSSRNNNKWKETQVAWVSCTDEPEWADECMKKFLTPMGVPLVDRVQEQCIYKANKQTHFKDLQKRTNIAFEDMIFFDNERGNINSVSKLGVCSVYCPQGMTRKIWESGIASWKENNHREK